MPFLEIIRIDGTREKVEAPRAGLIRECERLIGVECLSVVNLHDGRVMLVDDTGLVDAKPVNDEATKLYRAICRPGTTASIHGDVVIAVDKDFA